MITNTLDKLVDKEGCSGSELARRLGFERTSLNKYLKSRELIPSPRLLSSLCDYYDLPPSAFIHFEPNK